MDIESVLASAVEYHPLGTDAATGALTDRAFARWSAGPRGLRLALRASAGLPLLAGPAGSLRRPVVRRRRVAESIPSAPRSPRAPRTWPGAPLRGPLVAAAVPRSLRLLARTTLRNESPQLRAALFTRSVRTAVDVAHIAKLEADGRALSVRPAATTPPVSRLTTDGALLAAAFEAGREAGLGTFGRGPVLFR